VLVADQDDGPAPSKYLVHARYAFFLEAGVADGKRFINQQNVWIEVRGDGERKTEIHPARVVLDRLVQPTLDLRERDDLIEPPSQFRRPHALNLRSECDVLP
jgi:hypothetical protein